MPAPETRHRAHRRPRAPDTSAMLVLAVTATHAARAQLDKYATATDAPAWQVVEAADLLERVHDLIAEAARGTP